MKILIFGKNGQVARRLYNALLPLGQLTACSSNEVDFRSPAKLKGYIKNHKPDLIINSSAYTQVDRAETDHDTAAAINTEAVKIIADEATEINAWLIHYSTEYVFDGNGIGEYTEEDPPSPLSIYGKTKAAADEYIKSVSRKYIILRTSWVFDSYGKNFAKTILGLAQKQESLRVVSDQVGAPTPAALIAAVTAFIVYKIITNPDIQAEELSGLYNLTTVGKVSWHGFASALVKQAHDSGTRLACTPENVLSISSKDYPVPARRPLNSSLNTGKLTQKFGLVMPHWELYIPELLEELKIMGFL